MPRCAVSPFVKSAIGAGPELGGGWGELAPSNTNETRARSLLMSPSAAIFSGLTVAAFSWDTSNELRNSPPD